VSSATIDLLQLSVQRRTAVESRTTIPEANPSTRHEHPGRAVAQNYCMAQLLGTEHKGCREISHRA
jgi:hypothetical protein